MAKAIFSSSQEKEDLAAIRDLTTPPESNEESSFENSYACEGEQVFEQEIDEDDRKSHAEVIKNFQNDNMQLENKLEEIQNKTLKPQEMKTVTYPNFVK